MSPSGKYLIEDHILSTSQSPSVFLLSSAEAARRTEAKPERVLSVGNPQFDPVDFPDLANLPAAAEEAKEIAELFDSRVVLTGPQATPAAVKSNLNSADVVQLAMHSALDNEAPLRSKLIMAKDTSAASSESMLYAYEIYNLKLTRPRLVVLSACQTGAEQYYGGEGMMSLARAFIAAGVPQVVASLWPVDSDATKQLMVSFHKHRKEGRNTAESLQEAQKDLIKGANQSLRSVYYWGSFTLIGGYASF
jgi:CHAT domain-containing protein